MKILIIEDEKELTKTMVQYLSTEAYTCDTAGDFYSAMEKTESFDYDCILLDVSLPGGNGLEVLKQLKANNKSDGVIIISAKNASTDRVAGLNLGADDYLSKPFHLAELAARIASVIRRRRFQGQTILAVNELVIDTVAKVVMADGKTVELTRKEYDLLLFFVSNKNRVISKNAMATYISGNEVEVFDNFDFIYTHIKNLKRKLQQAGCKDYIKSIYGMGYKLST
ncbi:MAG: response regulator transcription factor [Luteolibacter sp.]